MNVNDILEDKYRQDIFDIVIEEACRQWCEFVDESPERKTGKGFANFFFEIFEHKEKEYLKEMDLAFVEQNYDKLNRDKFFKTDNGFIEEYYNPDATAGGQLVCVEISDDIIKDAAKIKDKDLFFSHIEAYGKQVLFDAGTPEFRDMLKSFMENKADFEGESKKSMYGLMKAVGIKPPNRDMER